VEESVLFLFKAVNIARRTASGASGIIFGFFAFTLATACLERPINVKAILLAVIVAFFYGSMCIVRFLILHAFLKKNI
jgi:uncharacterized membrane protein